MIYNAKIKVNIQGYDNIDVYYSYNNNTDFQDFLEYLAYLIPSANICQCSKFSYKVKNYGYKNFIYNDIKLDKKLYDFKNNFNNLCLNRNKKKCSCNNSFLYRSKSNFVQNFMNEFNNLNMKNNLNEKEISNLEKEKMIIYKN